MWCAKLPAYITHINIQGLQQMLLQVCLYSQKCDIFTTAESPGQA